MKPSHKLVRRSFLVSVVGGGAAVALLPSRAGAQSTYTGVTDCDSGSGADRPGYGRGVRNQVTDSDTGPQADARCHGRGSPGQSPTGTQYNSNQPHTGCSDSDYGPQGDPSGYGRTCWGRDPNPYAPRLSGCTDSDTGA